MTGTAGDATADAVMVDLIRSPDQSGCCCLSSAATPTTCGVAIEVPVMDRWSAVPALAAVMSTPGAVTSGFTPPVAVGPRPENAATTSERSTAPTLNALRALPGEEIDPAPGPSFPAAATNSIPFSRESRSTASSRGSVSGVSVSPRLRLTTCAPWSAAHCIPARIAESEQPPSAPTQTLPSSSRASGATPR